MPAPEFFPGISFETAAMLLLHYCKELEERIEKLEGELEDIKGSEWHE